MQSATSLLGQGHRPAGTSLEASAGATGWGMATQLRQGIAELLIHSLVMTLWLSFTCLGQQIGAEGCCWGYYTTVCYCSEVLNKIVSTSGNREMTCHETLVTLSSTPEPADLSDPAQGPSFISSDFGQMGWPEAPCRGMAEALVRLSPHRNIDQSVQGPCDGCRGSSASTVPRGSPPLQRAEGAHVSTGCSRVSAASRDQRCKSRSPHEEVGLCWERGASALPFAQQSRCWTCCSPVPGSSPGLSSF